MGTGSVHLGFGDLFTLLVGVSVGEVDLGLEGVDLVYEGDVLFGEAVGVVFMGVQAFFQNFYALFVTIFAREGFRQLSLHVLDAFLSSNIHTSRLGDRLSGQVLGSPVQEERGVGPLLI